MKPWKIVAGSALLVGTIGSSAEAGPPGASLDSDGPLTDAVQLRNLTPRKVLSLGESQAIVVPDNLPALHETSSIISVVTAVSAVTSPSAVSSTTGASVASVDSTTSIDSHVTSPSLPSPDSVASSPSPESSVTPASPVSVASHDSASSIVTPISVD